MFAREDAVEMPKKDKAEIVYVEYMEERYPAYMAYETQVGKKEKYHAILADFKEMREKLFDQKTGLVYDYYEPGKDAVLKDGKFKAKSMGYYLMGMIDTMSEVAQEIYEQYHAYQEMFKEAVKGVLSYYKEDEGVFQKYFQTAKDAEIEENPIDVESSLMIGYAIWKGCCMNVLLSEKYMPIAYQLLDCRKKAEETPELEECYKQILSLMQRASFAPWVDTSNPILS